jgi:hypothetical protein
VSTFEFTPSGIREYGPEGAAVTTGVVSAAQAVADLREQVARQEAARPVGKVTVKTAPPTAISPLKRRYFVKELRARLRVVERQIKSLRGLEEEALEIRRLIAAAKAPPAKVTAINTRKSG